METKLECVLLCQIDAIDPSFLEFSYLLKVFLVGEWFLDEFIAFFCWFYHAFYDEIFDSVSLNHPLLNRYSNRISYPDLFRPDQIIQEKALTLTSRTVSVWVLTIVGL